MHRPSLQRDGWFSRHLTAVHRTAGQGSGRKQTTNGYPLPGSLPAWLDDGEDLLFDAEGVASLADQDGRGGVWYRPGLLDQ